MAVAAASTVVAAADAVNFGIVTGGRTPAK